MSKKFHNTPVKTEAFFVELFDLATDKQKEELAWGIARGDFPVGFDSTNHPIEIFWYEANR